jgi:hypothetical protein
MFLSYGPNFDDKLAASGFTVRKPRFESSGLVPCTPLLNYCNNK